jgi:DNA-binding transcriptional MerR regulator
MSKSAEAFRTIGEVAGELDVPKHVLRFWEGKFPHIRPMKRGGGRRYYRPEDMDLLRGIRHLLHAEGYTIKGVQKILREQGVDQVKAAAAGAVSGKRAKGRGKTQSSVAAVTGQKPALMEVSATEKTRPVSRLPANGKDVILAAIRELEACRELLKGVDLGNSRDPVPTRAARS